MQVSFVLILGLLQAHPSLEIKVDQVGYLPDAPKHAMVTGVTGDAGFTVRSAAEVVLKGKLSEPVTDMDSGDTVRIADFSSVRAPGKYWVEVTEKGRSFEFEVGPRVFERAYYLAARSFYGQRCGMDVDLGPEFPGYRYAACHLKGEFHKSSGKGGTAEPSGGWHDAGDYGRYVVNSGLSTGTLLWAFELFGTKVKAVSLKIPESGNGMPDLLNEIRWNLRWMLSMQDGDGGVFHKQTSERFCGFVMPDKDTFTSYVIGSGAEPYKTSCATADFAAVMAIAARVYKPYDSAFAARVQDASQKAWRWLEKNPNVLFRNPEGVSTGAYGDRDCGDERLWAAAELWRTTREAGYETYFTENYGKFRPMLRAAGPQGWPNVAPMGLWAYVLGKGSDRAAIAAIRGDAVTAANQIVERAAKHAYRSSMTTSDYVWGSNGVAANYGMQLLVTNAIEPDGRYVDAAMDMLHYLLGRNTFSISWVTQVGANPYRHPHHRPSGADSNAEPWPGLLSGGPNRSKQDPAMRKMADAPPARMFLDEQESYATNEIAINWNAPLVFTLAGALPGK